MIMKEKTSLTGANEPFICKRCLHGYDKEILVKFNKNFPWNDKELGKRKNIPMFLELDGAPHFCKPDRTFNNKFKLVKKGRILVPKYFYQIEPGSKRFDFHELNLKLGPRIDGFTFQEGSKLLRSNNTEEVQVRWMSNDSLMVKHLTKITLDEFIDIYYSKDELEMYEVKDVNDGKKIPTKRLIYLLLKERGIDMISQEQYLIWSHEKAGVNI